MRIAKDSQNTTPEMDVLYKAKMDNGHWVQGFYYIDHESEIRNSYIIIRDFEFRRIKGFTLCEYTRLIDRKLKKIFTHDIVCNVATDDIGEVLLVDGAFVVKYISGSQVRLTNRVTDNLEIMSNKFDKPELLDRTARAVKKEDKEHVRS